MGKSSRRGIVLVLAAGIGLAGAGAGQAGTTKITDRKDTPGPLDIRSAAHGHRGAGSVTHTIRMFKKWPKSAVGAGTTNSIGLAISTKASGASTRIVIVFAKGERMKAVVIRPNGRVVGRASASKPNARTVRIVIRRSLLGNPGFYRWKAFSHFEAPGRCARGCSDLAPNRARQVLHDLTPPTIRFPAIAPPTTTSYEVSWKVTDRGGLRRWRLERRPLGEAAWTVEETGTAGGGWFIHDHVGNPGDSDEWRLVAVDRHGNQSVSPIRLVTIP